MEKLLTLEVILHHMSLTTQQHKLSKKNVKLSQGYGFITNTLTQPLKVIVSLQTH